MTKEQLWKVYTDKNPQFLGEGNITMSAEGLRKLFHQTYDVAWKDGSTKRKVMDDLMSNFKKNFKE